MRILFIVTFLFTGLLLQAQKKDTAFTTANLTHATVYYGYGAELQHSARASLLSGMQQVVIDGLALQADANTIQIACPENVTILSFYHRVYTKPVVRPVTRPMSKSADSIRTLQKELALIYNDQQITETQLNKISLLVENNFTTPDKKNISSEELIRLTNYYTGKIRELKDRVFQLGLKRDVLNEQIASISERMNNATTPADQPEPPRYTGQLILQVMATSASNASFDLSYYTRNAGWIPAYDIRMKSIDNSLKLSYKATVTQTTGLDWKGIRLNLSTSNPNQGNGLPDLNPVYLRSYVPGLQPALAGRVAGVQTDELKEVVVTAYSAKRDKYGYSTQTVSADDINRYTTLKESQLNTNFEIDLPYDIPSDGKPYSIQIKEEKLTAGYRHFAIPKLDNNAFLTAEISRWDSLSLLTGEAGVIMDNVYIGKSFIDPNAATDTLRLSLGRDKRIALERKLVKEFTRKTQKGNIKSDTYTYEITVRNNKKQPVDLLLKDQYPVSTVKEIEISLADGSRAIVDAEKGLLSWNLKLQPGERAVLRFSYTIKYPSTITLDESR